MQAAVALKNKRLRDQKRKEPFRLPDLSKVGLDKLKCYHCCFPKPKTLIYLKDSHPLHIFGNLLDSSERTPGKEEQTTTIDYETQRGKV